MQYEDIVYNAGILAMAVRLEKFLEDWERESGNRSNDKYARLRRFFETRGKSAKKGMHKSMENLFRRRDAIAHERANIGEDGFGKIRGGCVKADDWLANMNPPLKTRLPCMGEVMVSCSLRYDMGNAGDLVKHGVLAEFAEWWPGGELRYADPFGGRPWGWPKPTVRNRFGRLKDSGCALWRAQKGAQCAASGGLYYGSSHVVLNASGGRAFVFADDIDKLARADLKASGLRVISDEFRDQEYGGNGYSILTPGILKAGQFNLTLIDPHADFLRKELSASSEDEGQFRKIKDAIERPDNCNLWVAIFVLVDDENRKRYEERRESFFRGRGVALRCPRMPKQEGQPDGESHYDMEIMLVSSRLADNCPRIRELRERIAKFKAAAEKALGVGEGKILAWGI